jgi:hypothetical protein
MVTTIMRWGRIVKNNVIIYASTTPKTPFSLDKVYIKCYTIYIMKHILKKKLVHLGSFQLQQLEKISESTGYATADLIRRAIDEYIEKRYPDVLGVQHQPSWQPVQLPQLESKPLETDIVSECPRQNGIDEEPIQVTIECE